MWDAKSKTEANGLLTNITSFEFIVSFMTCYQFLSHLEGITVLLQRKPLDILEADAMVDDIKKTIRSAEEHFHKVYQQVVDMAATMPRISGRQRNRSNIPADSVEEYYLRNVAIPLVDYIISELDGQFSELVITSASLICLVPVVFTKKDVDLSAAVEMYRGDLPTAETFNQEYCSGTVTYTHVLAILENVTDLK